TAYLAAATENLPQETWASLLGGENQVVSCAADFSIRARRSPTEPAADLSRPQIGDAESVRDLLGETEQRGIVRRSGFARRRQPGIVFPNPGYTFVLNVRQRIPGSALGRREDLKKKCAKLRGLHCKHRRIMAQEEDRS